MRQDTGGGSRGDRDDYVGKEMGLSREYAAGLAALYRSVGAHPVWEKEAQTQVVFDEASGAFTDMMDDRMDLCEDMEPFYCYWMDEDPAGQHNLIGEKDIVVKKNCNNKNGGGERGEWRAID